jgi:hypothetical protein
MVKFYLWGAHPIPRPTQQNEGIFVDNFAGADKQNLHLRVGLHGKILFLGGSPQPRPAGSTQPNGGIHIEN